MPQTVLETGNFDAFNQIGTKIDRTPLDISSDDWEQLRDFANGAVDECISAAHKSVTAAFFDIVSNPLTLFTQTGPSEQLDKQISKAQNAQATLGYAAQGPDLKTAAVNAVREGFGVLYATGDISTKNKIGSDLYDKFNNLNIASATPAMGPLASTIDNKPEVLSEIGRDIGDTGKYLGDKAKQAANAVGDVANNVWNNVKDTANNLKNQAKDIFGDIEIVVVIAIVAGVALVAALIYAIVFHGGKVRETAGTVKAVQSVL